MDLCGLIQIKKERKKEIPTVSWLSHNSEFGRYVQHCEQACIGIPKVGGFFTLYHWALVTVDHHRNLLLP